MRPRVKGQFVRRNKKDASGDRDLESEEEEEEEDDGTDE